MKTKAFLIRVAICFILSLIPATEIENRIYSARLELRGRWGEAPAILIAEVPDKALAEGPERKAIERALLSRGAAAVASSTAYNPAGLTTDFDGVVRRATLSPPGEPTLVQTVYRAVRPGNQPPRKPSEPHLINYLGKSGTFPRCDLGKQGCAEAQGKIVLLESERDADWLRTPLGAMSRAEVIANDLNTVLYGRPIYQLPLWLCLPLILAMVILGAFYIIYYPVLISAIAVTGSGLVVVVILFQLLFQLFAVYIPSANIAGALLITYLIFTGYRLAFQENLQWRSLKQAQYLRELDQMKTNFLSIVSHDLKTPIAKIQAVTERLRREMQLPEEERSDWKDLLDSIENSNNELKHYINSILNLSRIESQKVILNKKSNDINQLINQALKRLRPMAQQKGIQIEQSLDPLFSIECDEDLLRQVITNIIDNAIKYSPAGSKVIVRSREEEGFVRVEVEDFGPGIPKDQLPLMFRKFSRFVRPLKEQVKGSGLGLYLSKYFIELHGGTIRVKSEEGKGTTFTFTLPLQGVESETILG